MGYPGLEAGGILEKNQIDVSRKWLGAAVSTVLRFVGIARVVYLNASVSIFAICILRRSQGRLRKYVSSESKINVVFVWKMACQQSWGWLFLLWPRAPDWGGFCSVAVRIQLSIRGGGAGIEFLSYWMDCAFCFGGAV